MAPELFQHQKDGIAWLEGRDRALLADEAGLGKTGQMLLSAKEPALVVAPAMVLESGTWDDEIALWTPGMDVTQVSYSSVAQRGIRGRVPRDANGFPLTPLKPEYRKRWASVRLDEAHYIKGRKTSWSNALMKLDSDDIKSATGTPIPNWAQEAYMLLKLLWPEKAKAGQDLGSYWRWAKEWFVVEKDFFGAMQVGDLREDRTWDQFREVNWGDRMIRRYRADCLDLPPLTHQNWYVKMSAEQAMLYKRLKADFIAWTEGGVEIDVWSEPGMLVKLAQLATGLEVLDPSSKPTGKLKVLETILQDRPAPTLVVAHFRNSIDAIERTCRRMGLSVGKVRGGMTSTERRASIRGFQAGELQVLVASINTISEGLTLHQGGADQIIKVERSFTPSKNEQVDRRLHRIGVEHPIHSIDLITKNTIDERQIRILEGKTDQQVKALGTADVLAMV